MLCICLWMIDPFRLHLGCCLRWFGCSTWSCTNRPFWTSQPIPCSRWARPIFLWIFWRSIFQGWDQDRWRSCPWGLLLHWWKRFNPKRQLCRWPNQRIPYRCHQLARWTSSSTSPARCCPFHCPSRCHRRCSRNCLLQPPSCCSSSCWCPNIPRRCCSTSQWSWWDFPQFLLKLKISLESEMWFTIIIFLQFTPPPCQSHQLTLLKSLLPRSPTLPPRPGLVKFENSV